MTNRFYDSNFTVQDGQFAYSYSCKIEYSAIANGFAAAQAEIDAIRPSWLPSVLGSAYQQLRVNSTATAIEFVSGKLPLLDVAASRALLATDAGLNLQCSNAGAMSITIPKQATTPIDTESFGIITQYGAGQVTLVPEDGTVVLRSADALLKTRVRYSEITWQKIGPNEWLIGGDRG